MTRELIGTIEKNEIEQVQVALDEFNGVPLIDVRVFTQYRTTGEMGPTKKGVSLKIALLLGPIEALQKAEAAARDRGLLNG